MFMRSHKNLYMFSFYVLGTLRGCYTHSQANVEVKTTLSAAVNITSELCEEDLCLGHRPIPINLPQGIVPLCHNYRRLIKFLSQCVCFCLSMLHKGLNFRATYSSECIHFLFFVLVPCGNRTHNPGVASGMLSQLRLTGPRNA